MADLRYPCLFLINLTDQSHLPTFSSPAIEVHLHRIPGLSRHWIYFNDDVVWVLSSFALVFRSSHSFDIIVLGLGKLRLAVRFLFSCPWSKLVCVLGRPELRSRWAHFHDTFAQHFACEIQSFPFFWISYSFELIFISDCPPTWLGDGYCDKACNVSECDFDEGDCLKSNTGPAKDEPSDYSNAFQTFFYLIVSAFRLFFWCDISFPESDYYNDYNYDYLYDEYYGYNNGAENTLCHEYCTDYVIGDRYCDRYCCFAEVWKPLWLHQNEDNSFSISFFSAASMQEIAGLNISSKKCGDSTPHRLLRMNLSSSQLISRYLTDPKCFIFSRCWMDCILVILCQFIWDCWLWKSERGIFWQQNCCSYCYHLVSISSSHCHSASSWSCPRKRWIRCRLWKGFFWYLASKRLWISTFSTVWPKWFGRILIFSGIQLFETCW